MGILKGGTLALGAREGICLAIGVAAATMAVARTGHAPCVADCRSLGAAVETLQVELAGREGVDKLVAVVGNRHVEALLANAGHGLGKGFLEQDFSDIPHVIDTNITGTLYLLHQLGARMRADGRGRIPVTGSIPGFMPGSCQAVYNASKAFIDSFTAALRNEMKDTGVTVTCLMPGATDTEFFARADMLYTKVGTEKKMDPGEVAEIGFKAMEDGEADVVAGLKNKMQVVMSKILPSHVMAEQHRKQAAPGTAKET
ncbi:MAG: SDR family NAD(P)-dependent oxidoreductase [Variovorax sp.]|nr:MAG: SDR family NAD(P)-dependent oxidoreductase [Variovorax sp.]